MPARVRRWSSDSVLDPIGGNSSGDDASSTSLHAAAAVTPAASGDVTIAAPNHAGLRISLPNTAKDTAAELGSPTAQQTEADLGAAVAGIFDSFDDSSGGGGKKAKHRNTSISAQLHRMGSSRQSLGPDLKLVATMGALAASADHMHHAHDRAIRDLHASQQLDHIELQRQIAGMIEAFATTSRLRSMHSMSQVTAYRQSEAGNQEKSRAARLQSRNVEAALRTVATAHTLASKQAAALHASMQSRGAPPRGGAAKRPLEAGTGNGSDASNATSYRGIFVPLPLPPPPSSVAPKFVPPEWKDKIAKRIEAVGLMGRSAVTARLRAELKSKGFIGCSTSSFDTWRRTLRENGEGHQKSSQRGRGAAISTAQWSELLDKVGLAQKDGDAVSVAGVQALGLAARMSTSLNVGGGLVLPATSLSSRKTFMEKIMMSTVAVGKAQDNTKTRIEAQHDLATVITNAAATRYMLQGDWLPSMTRASAEEEPMLPDLTANLDATQIVVYEKRNGHLAMHFVLPETSGEAVKSKSGKGISGNLPMRIKLLACTFAGGWSFITLIYKLHAHDTCTDRTPPVSEIVLRGSSVRGTYASAEDSTRVLLYRSDVSDRVLFAHYFEHVWMPKIERLRSKVAEIYDLDVTADADLLRVGMSLDGEIAQLKAFVSLLQAPGGAPSSAAFADARVLLMKLPAAASAFLQACDKARSFKLLKALLAAMERIFTDEKIRMESEVAQMKHHGASDVLIKAMEARPNTTDRGYEKSAVVRCLRAGLKVNGITLKKMSMFTRAIYRIARVLPSAFAPEIVRQSYQDVCVSPYDPLTMLTLAGQWRELSAAQQSSVIAEMPKWNEEMNANGEIKDSSIARIVPVSRLRRAGKPRDEENGIWLHRAMIPTHAHQRAEREQRDVGLAAAAKAKAKKKQDDALKEQQVRQTMIDEAIVLWSDIGAAGFVVVTPLAIRGKMSKGKLRRKYLLGLLYFFGEAPKGSESASTLVAALQPYLDNASHLLDDGGEIETARTAAGVLARAAADAAATAATEASHNAESAALVNAEANGARTPRKRSRGGT